ncbi:MAG: DUF2189 domain-containing protein [Burkholderiaceae bacterium]
MLTPAKPASPQPGIHTITLMQPLQWLALGWRDMARCGWISFAHGLVLTLMGAGILLIAHDRFWILAGVFSSFLIVAPFLATSLYALSRAVERGEKADAQLVLKTWLHWQHSHRSKLGHDYWCIVQFGALLALAGVGWVLTSAAFITLFTPQAVNSPADFIRHVVLAEKGWVFESWLMLGGLLAAPMFASSAVAIPLLLDRRVTLMQAVLTSWRTVLANPLPMAFWAALIMGFTLLGFASALLGLIAILPMLGHASWHAYRDLVDVSDLPELDAGPDMQAKDKTGKDDR